MTHVLRYRITTHSTGDIAYDGSKEDFLRALGDYEAKLEALKSTGAVIILEDARPVNVRKKPDVMTEPMNPVTDGAALVEPMNPGDGAAMTQAEMGALEIPEFMRRVK